MVCLQETITIKVKVYKFNYKCVSEMVQKILFDLCNSYIHHHPDTLSKSQFKFNKQKNEYRHLYQQKVLNIQSTFL